MYVRTMKTFVKPRRTHMFLGSPGDHFHGKQLTSVILHAAEDDEGNSRASLRDLV